MSMYRRVIRPPNRMSQMRISPKHIIIKISNIENKERILKTVREKYQVTFRGNIMRLPSTLFYPDSKIHEIFLTLCKNNYNPRLIYRTKISFKFKEEIKPLHDKN